MVSTIITEWHNSLTDLNHLFSNQHLLREIYDAYCIRPDEQHEGMANNNLVITPAQMNMVALHNVHGVVIWENAFEYFHRLGEFSVPVAGYEFGYIVGTHHPMASARKGMESAIKKGGYEMWERITYKTSTLPVAV